MNMPTLLFVAVAVVAGVGNTFAGGEYCMYSTFYLFCFLTSNSSVLLRPK